MRPARCLLLLAALPALAHADQVLYHSDFEAGIIDPEWGASARLDQGLAFTKFMGRYAGSTQTNLNNSVSITLPAPPGDTGNGGAGGATQFTLNFDFYCIDSWDGNSTTLGPDLFEVYINTVNMFSYTFSNNPNYGQSFPNAPTIGPSLLGFNAPDTDSIYRNISIPFEIGAATQIVIKWRSNGLQAMTDESWGIDNVNVTYTIPTPGSLALLGLGGLVLARRRR